MSSYKKLLGFILLTIFINAQSKGWTPELSININQISDLNFSNSNKVAMVIRHAQIEGEKSEYLNQIWLSDTNIDDIKQFTYHEKSSTHPRFSPNGEFLAFLSSRLKKQQIWVMRTSGGEAWQFTYEKQGVGSFKWSPSGDKISFLMIDAKTEQEEKNEKEKKDVILVDQNFKYSHLYLKTFSTKKDTSKASRITEGDFHITNFNWNPNNKTIVFAHTVEPTINSQFVSGDISVVNIKTKTVKDIVTWEGKDENPIFTPDGKTIVFTSDGGKIEAIGLSDTYKISSNGGKPKKLAETPNRNTSLITVSVDNNYVFVFDFNRTK